MTRHQSNKQKGHPRRRVNAKHKIGDHVWREFSDGVTYQGQIVSFDPDTKFYRILYTDGDEEDMDEDEINFFKQNNKSTTKKVAVTEKKSNKVQPSTKKELNPANKNDELVKEVVEKIEETLEIFDPTKIPKSVQQNAEMENMVIATATTSRSSYLSLMAHIIHTLRARLDDNDDDRLYDIVAVTSLSCTGQKIGDAFMPFCNDNTKTLPKDLQLYFEKYCSSHYENGSRDGGTPCRFRAVGLKHWPANAKQRSQMRVGIRHVVTEMKKLPTSGMSCLDFFDWTTKYAKANIRGVGGFRVGVLLQLLVLSGLAGEDCRILEQGRFVKIVPGTRPFKMCAQYKLDPNTFLDQLASELNVSHAVAEASLCEAYRSGGPRKEVYFRHQRMYEIGVGKIVVGAQVGGPL